MDTVKRKKTNIWLWLLLLPFLSLFQTTLVQAASLPNTPAENYFDQVNLLDSQTQNLVNAKNQQYEGTKAKPQIMLAVVKSTGDTDIDQYAADLFSKWRIGQKNSDNGILILYALNGGKRNVRIEVGYGLEDVVTDSQSGQILNNNTAELKSTSSTIVNQGLQKTFDSVATLVDKHYGYKNNKSAISGNENQNVVKSDRNLFNWKNILQLIVLLIFIGFIISPWGRSWQFWSIIAWLFNNNNDHFGGFGGGSSGGGSSGGGGASI